MAFQVALPKFEAADAQVLGVSVDFNDANKAWAQQLGLTFPLLSDVRRNMSKAYNALFSDATLLEDPKTIPIFYRSTRSWFVIDKAGTIRYSRTAMPREIIPTDELLQVVQSLP